MPHDPLDRMPPLKPSWAFQPSSHIRALELYRDEVIAPPLQALREQLDALSGSDDASDECFREDLADLMRITVEGFLLVVQSITERGLRALLETCAALQKPRVINEQKIQVAKWSTEGAGTLHQLFETLMGTPITAFDSYQDLNLLQFIGNALRHGDGTSARKLHELRPDLALMWLRPGTRIAIGEHLLLEVPADAPRNPPLSHMPIPEELLGTMIQAVIEFWEDLDYLRHRAMPSSDDVTQRLQSLREARSRRRPR